MIRGKPLPPDIAQRVSTLGQALERCQAVVFAYLFGGAARGGLTPLSVVDVAVYLDPAADPVTARLEATQAVGRHLATDEVDVVVLNSAPIALAGRVLTTRRVLLDREPSLRHRFESLAAREFADFRIFERRLLERRARSG
jgi:hypothetical protein